MSTNSKYHVHENIDNSFWRELGVKFDALNELSPEQKMSQMKIFLDGLSNDDLMELADITGISVSDVKDKEKMQKDILSLPPDMRDIVLYLRDFQNRRKKTIKNFYELTSSEKIYTTPLAQLHHLFNQSPSHLFSLFTFHLWNVRGSGELFSLDKGIASGIARKVATEYGFEQTLCDNLYKASGEKNKYRIFSYAIISNQRFIVLLYKQVNDTSIADFKVAIRNQEVNTLLFEINSEDDTLEIKASTQFEARAIKGYTEMTFNGVCEPVKTEVYRDYDKATFIETILNGKTASGKPVSDFVVDKVVFRASPLKNSPEVTLQLKNLDIWSSVMDAHEKGSVNIESIKDFAGLSFKAANTSRTIRSIVKENGNIIFTMDDSMLESDKLELIKSKFLQKFGIPLFQEISNDKFNDGKADLVDYVMAQTDPSSQKQSYLKELHQSLIGQKLLEAVTERIAVCSNKKCPYEKKIKDKEDIPQECPLCDSELSLQSNETIQMSLSKVASNVKKSLKTWCDHGNWVMHSDSELTHGNVKLKFTNLERLSDNKTLQVMVTDQPVHGKLLTKLAKMMTPLVIVFAGQQEKFIEKYNQDCIQAVNYGKLHVLAQDEIVPFFSNLYSSLELRAKNYVASAANKAYHSMLKTLSIPEEITKDYTSTDLEDDAYAMLKDLFPNAVKWGKEQSGKAVPEGVFSISYSKKQGNEPKQFKYAFSYDCKFTRKGEGYPLGIEEQRKAIDYVRKLNNSERITHYARKNQLSGHIFIYNCFSETQIKGMKDYFSEQLTDDYDTIPIFLKSEILTYLHSKYREHYDEVALARNYFLGWLYEALMTNENVVTKEKVDHIFSKILSKEYRETEIINMPKLTQEITRKDVV